MQEITKEFLREYFNRPTINLMEQLAGIPQGYLYKIVNGDKPLTKKTIEKIRPFIK